MAGNPNDPFGISGGDMLRKNDLNPKANPNIFLKPKPKPKPKGGGGGGPSAKKTQQSAKTVPNNKADDEDFQVQEKVKDPVEPPKPVVILSKPKWSDTQGCFGQKITASVNGIIPPEIEHVTKVTFTVYALPPDGTRDRIDFNDKSHLKDGLAEAELTLWRPHYKKEDGESLDKCEYIFVAKHRDSKEITSEKLLVTNRQTPRQLYEARLKEAVSKLRFVGFGRAEGSLSNPQSLYDDEYWDCIQERKVDFSNDGVLQLKKGKNYSDAIIAIIENPDLWKLDCMEFLQVCNLYAMIDPVAKQEFIDRAIAKILPDNDKNFCLRTFQSWIQRPFESTGLKVQEGYKREDPKEKWTRIPTGNKTELELESYLKTIPIGSRISWSIKGAEVTNPYRTENTIKMGPNAYAAHPFTSDEPGPTGYLSRERIELLMGEKAGKNESKFIKDNVFISDIAVFEAP